MDEVQLADTPLFKNVREDAVGGLLGHFEERDVAEGEEVFRQGDPGEALIVILSGRFDLLRHGTVGEVHLATLEPGAVLGQVSLIDGGPRSATLRAREPARIATMDRATFEPLWQSPTPDAVQLQLRVTQLVIAELRAANRKLSGLLDVPLMDTPESIQRLLGVVDKARRLSGRR